MRSGNTDAKREVQIIASWSLLSQSDWIRYTQHRVDWQDCWIESVRKDGFIQLVLFAGRKWRVVDIHKCDKRQCNTVPSQSDQYKAYWTNLLQSVDQLHLNIRSIFVWYPKRRIKEISKTIWWAERFNPTRDDILYCFIPQNKLLLFEDYYTKILTSVHWDLRHQSIPSIDWLVSLAVRGCVGRVETLLHSSIQSC